VRHVVELDGPGSSRRGALAPLLGAASPTQPDAQQALRPEIVRVVRRQVRAGTYRPCSDEVAELLIAWLFLPAGAHAA